jgi:hypothetical protein
MANLIEKWAEQDEALKAAEAAVLAAKNAREEAAIAILETHGKGPHKVGDEELYVFSGKGNSVFLGGKRGRKAKPVVLAPVTTETPVETEAAAPEAPAAPEPEAPAAEAQAS